MQPVHTSMPIRCDTHLFAFFLTPLLCGFLLLGMLGGSGCLFLLFPQRSSLLGCCFCRCQILLLCHDYTDRSGVRLTSCALSGLSFAYLQASVLKQVGEAQAAVV